LVDLPLGGYSYTWAHKSASKMSKLDRFLILEGDDEIRIQHALLLKDLNDITSNEALDLSQKAKLCWSIGGDETSKASMSRIITWKEVTDKISSRLLTWKINTLSSGGRLTLLKSVLTAISLYYMSICKAPADVLKDLESIRRDFFHGADKVDRKMPPPPYDSAKLEPSSTNIPPRHRLRHQTTVFIKLAGQIKLAGKIELAGKREATLKPPLRREPNHHRKLTAKTHGHQKRFLRYEIFVEPMLSPSSLLPESSPTEDEDINEQQGINNIEMQEGNSNETTPLKPPGFKEKMKDGQETSEKMKGESNEIIEIECALGHDMQGCQESLEKLINGMGVTNRDPGDSAFQDRYVDGETIIGFKVTMMNVYAPQDIRQKRLLWTFISEYMSSNDGNYILLGDYNASSDFRSSNGGYAFTRLSSDGKKMSKLDRFFLSEGVSALDKKDFEHVVVSSWNGDDQMVQRDAAIKFKNKLKKLKENIKCDENSRYFHRIINSKRRYLSIRGIKREGTWVSDPSQVKEVFLNHFRGKFSRMENVTVSQRSTRFKSLSEEQSIILIRPISMHELKDDVWSCGNDKAPGPDGFTFSLVERYWEILKTDILEFVSEFFVTGEWSSTNIHNLLIILHYFYVSSGLKINLLKSNLYGIGVKGNEVQIMAQQIHVCHGKLPFDYLGLSVGGQMSRIKMWEGLVNRFHKRLSKWKVSTLSIGGRAMLIKTVLVMASYDNGSLNIGSLEAFNVALLLKWRWRFVSNSNMLWVKVIKEIYSVDGGFDQLSKKVGNGSDTRFWEENWIAGNTLPSLYPRLYALELNPDLMSRLSEFSCSDVPDRWWWDIDTQVPRKVNILFWRVSLDRIPMRSNLLMRGINLPDIMYAICGNEIEERDHVFSSCDVAVCTWRTVFRWLQLSTVSMGTINDTMQLVDSCGMPEKKKKVIEAVCLTTIWVLWKFRNAFTFKSQELRKECIIDSIKELAFL
nr:RNA-directed DNA polymerase, eukaryota, reverse transcriptase zinc-binding domain protein [Tanacetum cinerariifolium]